MPIPVHPREGDFAAGVNVRACSSLQLLPRPVALRIGPETCSPHSPRLAPPLQGAGSVGNSISRGRQNPAAATPRVVYFTGTVPVHASIRFSTRSVHGHAPNGSIAAEEAQEPDRETDTDTEPNVSLFAFWRIFSSQWSVVTSEELHAKEPSVATCARSFVGCPESSARLEEWYGAMGRHAVQVFSLVTPFMTALALGFGVTSDWKRCLHCIVVAAICYAFTFRKMHPLFCKLLPVIASVVCLDIAFYDIHEGGMASYLHATSSYS